MNLKKLLAGSVAVVTGAATMVGAGFGNASMLSDPELGMAVTWMHENGLTKYDNVNDYNPMGLVTRDQFAHQSAAYAVSNLCMEPDATMACSFSDIDTGDASLKKSVIAACQLGLVKGSNGMYMPNDRVTKAAVLTVMDRAISAAAGVDAASEDMTPWWKGHFDAMYDLGITKETDVYAVDRDITRYEVALMLYRARYDECTDKPDFTDILNDILDVDDEDMDEDMDEDEDADDSSVSNGEVTVELSSNTPAGVVVPGRSNVAVVTYDVTAETAATLKSMRLERVGLSTDKAIERVTLYVDGVAVSRSKGFDSNDEAKVSFKPSMTLKAGETVEVTVVAEVGCGALENSGECSSQSDLANNQEFAVALLEVNDNSVGKITGNLFEIGAVNASQVEITVDEVSDQVQVGDKEVELISFDADNKSDYDVYINSITVEDDQGEVARAAENFVLEFNGDVVATVDEVNGDFITFILDTPVLLEEGDKEEFTIYADIVAGIDERIKLILDEEFYVMGWDDHFGAGLWVIPDTTYDANDFIEITAGDVTLEEIDLEEDEFREDKDNILLAEFDLTINAGENVLLEDITFNVLIDQNGAPMLASLDDLFDDIEIVIDGDNEDADDITTPLVFDDLDLAIDTATVVNVKVLADSADNLEDYVGTIVNLTLDTVNDMSLTDDDENEDLTDITPSFINFDDMELVVPNASIDTVTIGDITTVVGTENLELIRFEIESDDSSAVEVKEIVFSNVTNFNDDYVVGLELQRETASGWTTVDEESGQNIDGGSVDFDINVDIPVQSTQRFRLLAEISGNEIYTGNLQTQITSVDVEDDDGEDLITGTLTGLTGRIVTILANGTITSELDDDDINDPFYVLGGTDMSECLVEFELTSEFEDFEVEEMNLIVSGDIAGFDMTIDSVMIESDAFQYTEGVSNEFSVSNPFVEINIENNPLVVTSDSQNVCVRVKSKQLGFNTGNGDGSGDFTFALEIVTAKGVSSRDDVSVAATAASELIAVKPVLISDLTLLPGSSSLTASADIAKIKLTTDNWINRRSTSTTLAKLGLNTLVVNVTESINAGALVAGDFELRMADGDAPITALTYAAGVLTFDLTTLSTSDRLLTNSDTATMILSINTTTTINSDNDSITVEYDESKAGNLVYSVEADTTCALASCVDDGLRLGKSYYGKIITD